MSCLFCEIIDGTRDGHFVHRDQTSTVVLDHRPVFKGHALVLPTAHVPTLPELPAELRDAFLALTQRLAHAMETGLGAGGSFVATNTKVSQSVPHLHTHVVPRTEGDGLRGFFWPRTRYANDTEAAEYAERLHNALGSSS